MALKNADWFWCALVVMPAWASVGSGWGLARRRCNRCDGVASLHSQSHRGPVPVHDRGLAAATKKKAPKNTQEHVHTPRRPQGAGQGRASPAAVATQRLQGHSDVAHGRRHEQPHATHTRWRRRVDSTNNTIDRSSRKRLDPKTPKGRSHHPTACAQYLFGGSGQQGHRRDTRCGHSRAKHTQVRAWKGSGRTRGSLY